MNRPSAPRDALLPIVAILAACAPATDTTPPPETGTTSSVEEPALDPAHCTFEAPPVTPTSGPIAAGAVRAGYGARVLPMPIGAPLGGYGNRLIPLGQSTAPDKRARRFTKSFVPSVGTHDAPKVEALAIEAGEERLVILRADVTLVTENTLFEVEAAIASDGSMRGRVLLTASHSHAGWAGWQPSFVLMPGVDRPNPHLAERMIGALAAAAKDALAALEPARIGVAVDPAFDPGDTVNRDRRHENDDVPGPDGNLAGAGKDPQAWVMRVEREDGSLLAAVVDVPMHGTIGDDPNPLASTDATGAVARALSAEIGAPVLHLQGAAGDVSPAGAEGRAACPGASRCLDMPRMETLGARAAALLAPMLEGVPTTDTAVLEVVTRTFPVRRSTVVHRPDGTTLEYGPLGDITPDGVLFDASGKAASPIDELNTEAGAGLCGDPGAGSLAPIPGAKGLGPYSSCMDIETGRGIVFGLFDVDPKVPVPLCDTLRTTATAVRLDGLPSGSYLLVTAPGEAVAPYASYLRSRSPAGPDRTLIIGYAGDHAGYLLTAEDWLSGGYECSTNIWGPLEGEIILEGALAAAAAAWTPEREDPEEGSSRFVDWQFPDAPPLAALTTTDHGTPAPASPSIWWPDTQDPAAAFPDALVPRAVGAARFAWYGGDPAVDLPEITVEREASPGVFEPLSTLLGRPATSVEGAVVLTYTPDPLESPEPSRHIYAAVWQPVPPDPFTLADPLQPYSLPLGVYRLRVKGVAQGAAGAAGYEVVSPSFEVAAAPLGEGSSAVKGASGIEVTAVLPPAPGLRALREGPSDVGVPLAGPWEVTVSFAALPPVVVMVSPDAAGHGAVTLPAAELAEAVSIDVRDAYGNGGELAL